MFNLAGVINLVLGLYVLFQGGAFLDSSQVMMMSLFFFVFAAIDFYFPYALKKKWRADQAKNLQNRGGTGAAS